MRSLYHIPLTDAVIDAPQQRRHECRHEPPSHCGTTTIAANEHVDLSNGDGMWQVGSKEEQWRLQRASDNPIDRCELYSLTDPIIVVDGRLQAVNVFGLKYCSMYKCVVWYYFLQGCGMAW